MSDEQASGQENIDAIVTGNVTLVGRDIHVLNVLGADSKEARAEIVTTSGHRIVLDDDAGTVTIASADGLTIILDDRSNKIIMQSIGNIELSAAGSLAMQAVGNIQIQAAGLVEIKGTHVALN